MNYLRHDGAFTYLGRVRETHLQVINSGCRFTLLLSFVWGRVRSIMKLPSPGTIQICFCLHPDMLSCGVRCDHLPCQTACRLLYLPCSLTFYCPADGRCRPVLVCFCRRLLRICVSSRWIELAGGCFSGRSRGLTLTSPLWPDSSEPARCCTPHHYLFPKATRPTLERCPVAGPAPLTLVQ